MNVAEAKIIAAAHIEASPHPHEDYSWVVREPSDTGDCWYFDYHMEHNHGLPQDEWILFAGAFGFLVNKSSGDVSIVSGGDFGELKFK